MSFPGGAAGKHRHYCQQIEECAEGNYSSHVHDGNVKPSPAEVTAYAPIVFATLLLIYITLLMSLPAIHELLEFLVR